VVVINIIITGEITGKRALLYELLGRKGRRKFVPTYVAFAECCAMQGRFAFSVVRDSSPQVFSGLRDRYDEGGECPPSGEIPFIGIVRDDGLVGFRIQLFDSWCERRETLTGEGSIPRRHVQIHVGAAASHGCIMVAGRRRWYYSEFEKQLRRMLIHTDIIRVTVQPR
jgi:hypothetical protein